MLEKTGITDFYSRNTNSISSSDLEDVETINYDPPTNEEKNAGDAIKQEIIDNEQKNPPEKSIVKVILVDSSQYGDEIEVRAFVENFVEDGNCTINFTNGDKSIDKTVPAFADASSTPCITLTLPVKDFPEAGMWSVKVTYNNKNNTVQGSVSGEVDIQKP